MGGYVLDVIRKPRTPKLFLECTMAQEGHSPVLVFGSPVMVLHSPVVVLHSLV